MQPTVEQLVKIAPSMKVARAEECLRPLLAGAGEFGIESPRAWRAYLATITHESTDFTRMEENLYYRSAERLHDVWPKRFPRLSLALPYVRNPEKLANFVYGGRDDLGNRPGTTDGWDFRGGGPIQATGRDMYLRCGQALDLDLVGNPDLIRTDLWVGFRAAAWIFVVEKRCLPPSEIGTETAFRLVTRRINGGTVGWEDRLERFRRARTAIAA